MQIQKHCVSVFILCLRELKSLAVRDIVPYTDAGISYGQKKIVQLLDDLSDRHDPLVCPAHLFGRDVFCGRHTVIDRKFKIVRYTDTGISLASSRRYSGHNAGQGDRGFHGNGSVCPGIFNIIGCQRQLPRQTAAENIADHIRIIYGIRRYTWRRLEIHIGFEGLHLGIGQG